MAPNDQGPGPAGQLFDEVGVESLYLAHRGLIAAVVTWKLSGLPKEDAEEVVSSVWAKLLASDRRRLRTFSGRNGATLATWLARVAANAARDWLRARRIEVVSFDASPDGQRPYTLGDFLRDRNPDPLETLLAREARNEVRRAVRALPWAYRRVVLARFYRGLTAAEAASRLGLPQEAVYIRLCRGLAALRRRLA